MGKRLETEKFEIPTLWGVFIAEYSDNGLRKLVFPRKFVEAREYSRKPDLSAKANKLAVELAEYIAGKRKKFSIKPDLSGYSEFSLAVWEKMSKIPYGQTMSYGEVARAIGRPKAARAVGRACGANPVPVIIPCHRIVAKGSIGGFGSGLDWKRRLFSVEAITG